MDTHAGQLFFVITYNLLTITGGMLGQVDNEVLHIPKICGTGLTFLLLTAKLKKYSGRCRRRWIHII